MPGNASGGINGIALKPLTVSFAEPGFNAKLAQENLFGPWFTLSNREKQQLGDSMGPQNPQALNRYSYTLNNPVRYVDPSGHLRAKRVAFGQLSYETVRGTPNSQYVDAQGGWVYTDSNGIMYRITADGDEARLFRMCVGSVCKYGYEGTPAVDQFINSVDGTVDKVIGALGDYVIGGATLGCVTGMIPTGPAAPLGCGAGAIVGGTAGTIVGVGFAALYYRDGVAEAEELLADIRDKGKPLPVQGPPAPAKSQP